MAQKICHMHSRLFLHTQRESFLSVFLKTVGQNSTELICLYLLVCLLDQNMVSPLEKESRNVLSKNSKT